MKASPTIISCGGDLCRLVSVELRPKREARTTIEIIAKADLIQQLACGQYVDAEREVWRRVHAAWNAEDQAYREAYETEWKRILREHGDRCRLADQDGLPHPPEPQKPVYAGPESPEPIKSSRTVLDMKAGSIAAVLSWPRPDEGPECLELIGDVVGAPKLIVEGWDVVLSVRVEHRPSNDAVTTLREHLGETVHIYASQRDIEEAIAETETAEIINTLRNGNPDDYTAEQSALSVQP